MLRPKLRINLLTPESRQAPFLEWNDVIGLWRIWQSFDPNVEYGTYLALYMDGMLDRVTVAPSGMISNITTIVGEPR